MRINIKSVLALTAGVLVCFACAKEKEESQRSIQEKVLDAYIAMNCPTAQKLPSGLTIIEKTPGTGRLAEAGDGVYIHYSTYSLDGVCQSTTDSVEARMLGTYTPENYYGPSVFVVGVYGVTVGISELLKQVGTGGSVTAIIPPWLTSYGGSGSTGQQSTINTIYKVRMGHIIDNLIKFQADSLDRYSAKNYTPKIDSLSYGYYFRNFTHTNGIDAADTVKASTSVNVWYVGRLLDGYIFDTNIRDTAKKYGIYDASAGYEPLKVTMEASYQDMSSSAGGSADKGDGGKGSLVSGFARALKKMTIKDNAVTFFMSGFGYGSSGTMSSGKGVPEYAMLRFDIWMGSKDDKSFPPTLSE